MPIYIYIYIYNYICLYVSNAYIYIYITLARTENIVCISKEKTYYKIGVIV